MASNYLLDKIDPNLHADLKAIAERQRRTIRQVILIALDREIQRTLKDKRASEHCPLTR